MTGGAGFIGHHFVNFLLKNTSSSIVVVDNLYNGDFNRINKSDRVTFINCSSCDVEEFSDHIDDSDYIFHMSCVQISKSSNVPIVDLETNALSTLNILEYLKNNKTSIKKFIYTSSCSIYGQSEVCPSNEKTPPNISSIYAATKYLGENYTNLYHKLFNIPVSIIRYSNVYGPGQTPDGKICGVIGKFIYQSLNNQTITIFGNGEDSRDYTYIDDVIDATYLISKSDKCNGKTYNISTNTGISVNEIIRVLKSNIGEFKVEYCEPRIIDNITKRVISYDELNKDTGWRPINDINQGIKKTIKYFKK